MENNISPAEIRFAEGFLEALGTPPEGSSVNLSNLEKALQSLDPLLQKSVMFTFGLCDPRLIPLMELEREATERRETIWNLKEQGMAQIRSHLGLPEIPRREKRCPKRKLRIKSEVVPQASHQAAPQQIPQPSSHFLAESLYRFLFEMNRLAGILFSEGGLILSQSPAAPPEKEEAVERAETQKEELAIDTHLPEQEILYSGRSNASRLLRSEAFREDLGIAISFEKLQEALKHPDLEKYIREILITTYCTKGYDRFSPYKIAKSRGGSPKTIQKWVGQAIEFIRQNA